MEKTAISVTTKIESFEEAKELLADLEVLTKKYLIHANISIFSREDLGEYCEQTE